MGEYSVLNIVPDDIEWKPDISGLQAIFAYVGATILYNFKTYTRPILQHNYMDIITKPAVSYQNISIETALEISDSNKYLVCIIP